MRRTHEHPAAASPAISGKTHTLLGLLDGLYDEMGSACELRASVIEVDGSRCRDLRTDRVLVIRDEESTDGEALYSTCIIGLSEESLSGHSELAAYVVDTQRKRVSRKTGVHDSSSRTHIIYRFGVSLADGSVFSLDLVDLAGSEWAVDQRSHDAELVQQARSINSSLRVLKDCLAARAALCRSQTMKAPYRESLLTRLLRQGLSSSSTRVAVIACVSPGSLDTEHSIDTLTNVCPEAPTVFETNIGSAEDSGHHQESKVEDWTPEQVCQWFDSAAAEACTEVAREMGSLESTPPSTFTVSLSAKRWASLRLESKDALGIIFDKGNISLPQVAKLSISGYVQMIRDRRLKEGAVLCGIGRTMYEDHERERLFSSLKLELKQFKAAVIAHREYQDKRPRFMTEDMLRLRSYILHGSTSAGVNLEAEAVPSLDSIEQTLQEPEDYLLDLTFRDAPPLMPVLPQCPSVFTGRSRTGQVWGGRELVDKYALHGPHRLIAACDGDARLGTKLHAKLLALIDSQSSRTVQTEESLHE